MGNFVGYLKLVSSQLTDRISSKLRDVNEFVSKDNKKTQDGGFKW